MEAKAQEQEGANGFRGCARITTPIRHTLQDFIRDLSIFTHRALRFQDRHNWFEWISMYFGNALNLLHPV